MNADIRLSVDFFDHPKTLKLERRLGSAGVIALVRLWCFAAKHRSDGFLCNMDVEDIELSARFVDGRSTVVNESLTTVNGVETGSIFVDTLVELRWLELTDDGVTYRIHDWKTHNSYAAEASERSDSSRLSRLAKVNRDAWSVLVESGRTGITRDEFDTYKKKNQNESNDQQRPLDDSLTTVNVPLSPAPTPAPVPTPIDNTSAPRQKRQTVPDSDHHIFIAWWTYAFRQVEGYDYVFSSKDANQVKRLLSACKDLRSLVLRACTFLLSDDEWLEDGKRDLSVMLSRISAMPPLQKGQVPAARDIGIFPPDGVLFENWKPWEVTDVD